MTEIEFDTEAWDKKRAQDLAVMEIARSIEIDAIKAKLVGRPSHMRCKNPQRRGRRVQPNKAIFCKEHISLSLVYPGRDMHRSPRNEGRKPRRDEVIRCARLSKVRFNSAEVQRASDEIDEDELWRLAEAEADAEFTRLSDSDDGDLPDLPDAELEAKYADEIEAGLHIDVDGYDDIYMLEIHYGVNDDAKLVRLLDREFDDPFRGFDAFAAADTLDDVGE